MVVRRCSTLAAAFAVVVVAAGSAGGAPIVRPATSNVPVTTYVTNGSVDTVVDSGGVTYIGGSFSEVGPRTGPGVAIDATTGNDSGFAQVSGGSSMVDAVAGDGSGGFYVGGDFTHVGGIARHDLAHILSNGSVDPSFDPSPDGQVDALAVSGAFVYVGGSFNTIGGQSRSNIAALTNGTATSWNPDANNAVKALAVSGSVVYAGGDFNNIGSASRFFAAALDTSSGLATTWDPHPSSSVYAIGVSGSTIYLGGAFTAINWNGSAFVSTRNHIAAVDDSTGTVTSWAPAGTNGVAVESLALSGDGSTIYIGGNFLQVGAAFRRGAAAFDTTTGALTSWDPEPSFVVAALAVSGTTLYAGGAFSFMNGQERNGIAAFDTTTPANPTLTSWNPNASSEVMAIAATGSTVYAGGIFTSIGGVPRGEVAAIDDSTGHVTSWDPEANGFVLTLAVSGSTVYAGGTFTTIGGQSRSRLAALDASTGAATIWNPSPDGEVNGLAVSGSTVYLAGSFTHVGGQARNYLAGVDASTGNATAFNPNANDFGTAVAVSGSTVYAGGLFTTINSASHSKVVALDATTGAPASWDAAASPLGNVQALAVSGSTLYVGGSFTSIGGQSRTDLAALNASTGTATSWNPNPNGVVEALAVDGTTVYAGGQFHTIGDATRNWLAGLDATSGNATAFDPEPNGVVDALFTPGTRIFAGGGFDTLDLAPQQGLAVFNVQPALTVSVTGSGSVSSSPAGIACGLTCTHSYADGTPVTLTALASGGTSFLGWSGGGCSGTGTCQVTLHSDTTVTAAFGFPTPTVTTFTPSSGGLHATVTVTGTNFTGATHVRLNGTDAPFSVASATKITFTVPTGATSGTIAVTTPGGTATSAGSFTITPPPSITSLSPTSGPVGTARHDHGLEPHRHRRRAARRRAYGSDERQRDSGHVHRAARCGQRAREGARHRRLGDEPRHLHRHALSGTDGEAVDDLAEHARVRGHLVEARAGAGRGVVGEAARAVDAVQHDVAVAVEDVVDDLEQETELLRERAPRLLLGERDLRRPERHRDGREEQAAGLQAVDDGEVGLRDHRVEVLAADHPERRLRKLARHVGGRIPACEPERLGEERIAGEHGRAFAVRRPDARLPAPFLVVVEPGQVVVDEREVVHELDRERRRHHLVERHAERLADRERDDGPHALAAHLHEPVARRLRLPVQLVPEIEPLELVLGERLQLVRTVRHPAPTRAARAPAPPPPTSRAPRARRESRAPAPGTRSRRSTAGRARCARPRAGSAAPPRG